MSQFHRTNMPNLECSILGKIGFSWLRNKAACFKINGNQVKILNEPNIFYNTLLEKCRTVEKRIVMASLYLGTGPLEAGLVSAIRSRVAENPQITVNILLDCMRGTRGQKNSRTMLLPLLEDHSESCQVNLYHTPRLRGLLRRFLPNRYNEIVGLQHMKLYLFDDDLIITGANLSEDYFTNRQDRYMVIENCKDLGDFVAGLCNNVATFSFSLNKKDELSLHPTWSLHPVHSILSEFVNTAKSNINDFYNTFLHTSLASHATDDTADTVIYPLLEMGHIDLHQDSKVTRQILETFPSESEILLATGYFNVTSEYANSILKSTKANFSVLMAHPQANGFYHAKGPAGGIPKGYSELGGRFFDKIQKYSQQRRVHLFEFLRKDWTFHAKGLWYTPPKSSLPVLTLIGSPNFGERSVHHDLECQFLIITENNQLQMALKTEQDKIREHQVPYTAVERKRKPPLWVYAVLYFFKTYL